MKILIETPRSNKAVVYVKTGIEMHELEPGAQCVVDVRRVEDIFLRGDLDGDQVFFHRVILQPIPTA